jgi:hypothetical protein
MARRERLLRARLGLPQGLIERAEKAPVLKRHGSSRVAKSPKKIVALAAEGMQIPEKEVPQGLRPRSFKASAKAKRP